MANPTLDDEKELLKKEKRRISAARWRKSNPEYWEQWYKANKEKAKETTARWHKANIEKNRPNKDRWRKSNIEKHNASGARWRKSNPDKSNALVARWRKLNPEKVKVFNKKSHLKRLSTPEGRLNHDLSRHMSRCLSKTNQTASQLKHSLPYTISELRAHIERQFPPGMSWEKRSEWHIDHIIPLSSFKFTSSLDTEFKAAWALSNLRPLWKKENLSKGKKKLTLL